MTTRQYMLICCGTTVGAVYGNEAGEPMLIPLGGTATYSIEYRPGGVNRRGDTQSAVPLQCRQCGKRVTAAPTTVAEFITCAEEQGVLPITVTWPPDEISTPVARWPQLIELFEQLGWRQFSVLAFQDLCYFMTKLDRL